MVASSKFKTTTLTTGIIHQTKELEVFKTGKRIETITEAVEKSVCSRKIAKTYLDLEPSDDRKSYAFRKFEKVLHIQCQKQHEKILSYLKVALSKRCNSSTTVNIASSTSSGLERKDITLEFNFDDEALVTESAILGVTKNSCENIEDQIDTIERLLLTCSKRHPKIAEWVNSDDTSVCQFQLTTERPITQVDKVVKAIETEAETTAIYTGGLIVTTEKVYK